MLVDDDTRVRTLLGNYLTQNGYRVTTAATAEQAHRIIKSLVFDLLILDVMLPGESGLSMAQKLRLNGRKIPILMLSAQAESSHRIEGLEAGADDYMAKPFDPREFILRVSSIVKRTNVSLEPDIAQIVFGPFTFVLSKRELKRRGELVHLTNRERDIMVRLAKKVGEPIPRHKMFSENENIGERTIDVQINHLRRKIEQDSANPRYLQTVRGAGYRLSVN